MIAMIQLALLYRQSTASLSYVVAKLFLIISVKYMLILLQRNEVI